MKRLLLAGCVVTALLACFAGKTYAADVAVTLDDNAGASSFVVQDVDKIGQFKVNSDGYGYFFGSVGTMSYHFPNTAISLLYGGTAPGQDDYESIEFRHADCGGQSFSRVTSIRTGSASTALTFLTADTSQPFGVGKERMRITSTGNVGIGTKNPDAPLTVNGTTRTSVLQITGGADISENFDINATKMGLDEEKEIQAQPGMVVCIDAGHPGELVVSTRAYDRTVAGVMSGAGGVKTGMLMGQEGSAVDGKHPVALTGRVYCYADATYGEIEPGDMLTTSDTPGHAMKVSDYNQAYGAVIGKAMTGLKEGKGLILALVNLQ